MTVSDRDAIDLLHRMVAIPSPSGRERALALFLVERLDRLGFDARLDEVGNVVAETGTGTGGPTVLLLSHLDTVDHQIPVRRDGTVLYGRGCVDAKGALAAMACAAARRTGFPGRLRLVAAVEEEWLARGGHHVARTQQPPDALLVGEPSGWSRVVLGYKGKLDLTYRVTRPSTHSTNPAPKATEVAVEFWHRLLAALGPDRDHGAFHRPAATLRAVSGDPTDALLDVDCRLPPGYDVDAFTTALRAAAVDGDLTIVRTIPAARADRSNPVARALSAAIRQHGGTPRPTLKTGTSDMNTVSERWTVPMAAYGPGDSSLDHGDDEHLDLTEYLRATAILTTTLDELVQP
jgi:LysW-gamma-L-lysine carboxypeptidase